MKKILMAVMSVLLVVSICGCSGGSNNAEAEVNLGDKVETDIIEFTMESASLAYYGSSVKTGKEYAMPSETATSGIFTTTKGHVFVAMTFTIKNLDRGRLDVGQIGNASGKWALNWKVVYDGKEYVINKFDLNNSDGTTPFQLSHSLIIDTVANKVKSYNDSMNYIMEAGEEITVRALGIAKFEPNDLKDDFKIIVSLIDSEGKEHHYTYVVNQSK